MITAIAQMNPAVGAIGGNTRKILQFAERAVAENAELVVFPELALSGYPPEDLVLKPHFVDDCRNALTALADKLPPEAACIVGTPFADEDGRVFNAAAVIHRGELKGVYRKIELPNYGVFDEKRVFSPGHQAAIIHWKGLRIGLQICEDTWRSDGLSRRALADAETDLVINLSASPFHRRKLLERERTLKEAARRMNAPLLYCNLVGGQDELVFDGAGMAMTVEGTLAARARHFEEDLLLITVPNARRDLTAPPENVGVIELEGEPTDDTYTSLTGRIEPAADERAEVYHALTLGLRDYVNKNGFKDVVIAISGGIDSALVAALAVDALGADRVHGITLPSQFTSSETLSDAETLARNLGIHMDRVAIKPIYDRIVESLQPLWADREEDITEENIQARIRGLLVMALSNKFNRLVLSTGNKSELATGYCTLYGDMVGGFAVIKDVPKTLVFELSEWRNAQADPPVIPPTIIARPPSAELRADQKDSDSLPPYDLLDPILERYVERDWSVDRILADGYEPDTVRRVARLVDRNEYKRRQGAPGIKITPKAFGRDRRMPITNRYEAKGSAS